VGTVPVEAVVVPVIPTAQPSVRIINHKETKKSENSIIKSLAVGLVVIMFLEITTVVLGMSFYDFYIYDTVQKIKEY
jgi:hypothetical protein